ncbi:uncharacterized protein FOMMEDRAFT_149467 [Fomitiporia mediterranea MF3/22]|uniref:uncharacterized protein n=1 Tax=Fomitiporia mediterranea (strain MF3/22) TaxID=694068 RepID=UPI00044087D6|nr:uncharacterized protein FOMMEDRAFT_149467 [Fomitiporia mediterranea MF3/22]EJC98038.1 hypothetical protein FOMMEDRAFT_149467 [Fomitiporia mediterranea MF3/22]
MSAEAGSSKAGKIWGSSFDSYNSELQSSVLQATKLAVGLPADVNFFRTVDNNFAQAIDSCSRKALALTNNLLELAEAHNSTSSRIKGKKKLGNQEDVVDGFGSLVVDVLDQLFERADTSLDDYMGHTKPAAISVKPPPAASTFTSSTRQGRLDPSLLHAAYLPKPQLKFRRRINSAQSSWSPNLRHKYNAQVPLGYVFHDTDVIEGDSCLGEGTSQSFHPYRYEIKHITYSRQMFEHRHPIRPSSFENTPFTWIDSKEQLDLLLDQLRHVQEIAVDLEHHSYRSFSGFLCLMQISTREEDFIIDTLALREELEELNEIFTDPKIVKVLHGADSDVVWLQQDFNIYIVNLFDTYHASKLLDFPKHGLGALLEMYCDFVPDKRYQLADWRIRPLPDEMMKYARSDTHFLLYIYDNLRNALLDRARGQPDLVRSALSRSEDTALRIYEPEFYDLENGTGPGGWNTLSLKWGRALSGTQHTVFRAAHAWRDALARKEDESTRYVMPNHYLFQLAERPPTDMANLLSIFRPVPPLVRTQAASLLEVIRTAVKEVPSIAETRGECVKTQNRVVDDANSQIRSKHNTTVNSENASTSSAKTCVDIWTRKSGGLSASSSSLLGSTLARTASQVEDLSVTRSALFPKGWTPTKTAKRVLHGASIRYREAVSRIHSALVVAPIMPAALIAIPGSGNLKASVNVDINVASVPNQEQTRASAVPANEQQPHTLIAGVEASDTILTTGRTRERKGKRSRNPTTADEQDKANQVKKARVQMTSVNGDNEAIETKPDEFDYASAPNLLDEHIKDQPVLLKPQKGNTSKGRRAFEYGNFPAPPRAYNEVKGANMSHTFKGR